MLISLNWIRDFVDLPAELDPRQLAERFTRTTAEVDGVEAIRVDASGLITARVLGIADLRGTHGLRLVTLDIGGGKTVETVTAAPVIHPESSVVYAPDGASVVALGTIGTAKVAGQTSVGMILPGDAVGIAMANQEAVVLDRTLPPGETLPADLFNDWVIEIDNKSMTHRPDLWGHYGIAREIAALYDVPLKAYPVVPIEELSDEALPAVEIVISDPKASPRYSALVVEGVPTQPAPLWMQLRLGHVGLRSISGLVDLTNYIMADLGQPMHAFDAGKVERIEVDWAKEGETFRTLDGVERCLTRNDLMIQSGGKSVALAGLMGGLETEVSESTTALLLESANFAAATIRKTATRLGHRTDASARFEKSLDPAHTVLGIQRFVQLARPMYPELRITRRLSDGYPQPMEPVTVSVDSHHVTRTIGREVSLEETARILNPLGLEVTQHDRTLAVSVPTFRATGDISIEADVIEEIARFVGYNTIESELPRVSIRRFEPHALHELEQRTLEFLTMSQGYHEIQGYLWYDAAWLTQLGIEAGSCVELENPAAEGLHQLRRSMIPGMLAAVARNRFHFSAFSLVELGSVYERGDPKDHEYRHLGLVSAQRGKGAESDLLDRLKAAVEGWSWERFGVSASFAVSDASPQRLWEHPHRTAAVRIGDQDVGRISVIDLSVRRAMDDHLTSWAVVWAELSLTRAVTIERVTELPDRIPPYPLIEIDVSVLVPRSERYDAVMERISKFDHGLLDRVQYLGCFEGKAVGAERRSLTFRATIGDSARTLLDEDAAGFRRDFEDHLTQCGYEIRR